LFIYITPSIENTHLLSSYLLNALKSGFIIFGINKLLPGFDSNVLNKGLKNVITKEYSNIISIEKSKKNHCEFFNRKDDRNSMDIDKEIDKDYRDSINEIDRDANEISKHGLITLELDDINSLGTFYLFIYLFIYLS
jgi:hypothetical protein